MKTFSTQFPFPINIIATIPSNDITTLEKQLHDKFSHRRTRGEWFELTDEEILLIKSTSECLVY